LSEEDTVIELFLDKDLAERLRLLMVKESDELAWEVLCGVVDDQAVRISTSWFWPILAVVLRGDCEPVVGGRLVRLLVPVEREYKK
jgi:hypothetical protein